MNRQTLEKIATFRSGVNEITLMEQVILIQLERVKSQRELEVSLGFPMRGSDSNGAKSYVKGRSWDRLAGQDLSPSVSQGTIWRYVAVDRRLGYA